MNKNQQEPEKRVQSGDGSVIAVNSIFHTIQGEGPFNGEPAVFVRLAGCNLQCPLCDTEYTERKATYIGDILDKVHGAILRGTKAREGFSEYTKAFCDLVVITGGEPFRQPIGLLIKKLIDDGFRVQVETNGTLFQPAVNYAHEKLTIVCSPKTGQVNRELLPWVDAFKYVASVDSLVGSDDGLPMFALEHTAAPRLYRKPHDHPADVYLQPVDEGGDIFANASNQAAVVQSCLRYGYRLCLQMHKIVGVA